MIIGLERINIEDSVMNRSCTSIFGEKRGMHIQSSIFEAGNYMWRDGRSQRRQRAEDELLDRIDREAAVLPMCGYYRTVNT